MKALFVVIPLVLIVTVWTIVAPNPNRRSDSQINQDADCRKLRQKSEEAKTQDELIFANSNFLARCADWNPPNY